MLPSSPPPPAAEREAAAVELLRRASVTSTEPRERIRAALAAVQISSLPKALRCRAHLSAAELLNEYADEPLQTVTHMRHAVGLCERSSSITPRLRLAVLCRSTAICQDLVRSGQLKDARQLLETLQGALQPEGAAEADDEAIAPPPPTDPPTAWLLAHVGVLHVCLLVREGYLKPAERMLPSVRKKVDALPKQSALTPPKGDELLTAAAASSFPTRTALMRVLEFQHALLLAQQGELKEAATALDAIIRRTAEAASSKGDDAETAAEAALHHEAKLLRASVHIASYEFDDAVALAKQLRQPLCAKQAAKDPKTGRKRPRHLADRRAHGTPSLLLLLAHAALGIEQHQTAAELVARASAALDADPHPAQSALSVWCKMLRILLEPSAPTTRQEAVRRLAAEEEARSHRLLRGTLFLVHGEASLALGQMEEAERRLARCIKLSVGESRCDALAAASLAAIAAALGSRPAGDGGEDSGSQGGSAGSSSAGGGQRGRTEDSLSSALMISSKMEDLHIQLRALKGWAKHYESIGDTTQAKAFNELLSDFEGKLSKRLKKAKCSSDDLRKLAQPI